MTIKLIEVNTKQEIGTINLKFLPRTNDLIIFKEKTYICSSTVHSEKELKLKVSEGESPDSESYSTHASADVC